MDSAELQTFYSRPLEAILSDSRGPEAHAALLEALETGRVRAALRREDGAWEAQSWVKAAILAGFRATDLVELPGAWGPAFDRAAFPPRPFTAAEGVRLVPLSAYTGFFGCCHFSQANAFLESCGRGAIDWRV